MSDTYTAAMAARFWSRVARTEACWLWKGATNRKGYGATSFAHRSLTAHRVAWALSYGPIPAGLFVCHRCDNPPCVRPDHLFLGSAADNTRDAMAKGRMRVRHMVPGHSFHCVGSANKASKFTETDVVEIRALRAAGATQTSLAERFSVSQHAIWRIVSGRGMEACPVTTSYTAADAHDAAARGAAWLDGKCPGWEERIDLDILNLADAELCMLGQTADCIILGTEHLPNERNYGGGYWRVFDAEGWTLGGGEQRDLGFDIPRIPGNHKRRDTAYEMLAIAWKLLIRERLAVPA